MVIFQSLFCEVLPEYLSNTGPKPKVIGFEDKPFGIAFRSAIKQNFVYPDSIKENRIEGKVFVQFDIDSTGFPINLKVIKDTSKGVLGEFAIESVKPIRFELPTKGGKVIDFKNVTVPVTFRLNSK